jgi:predicted transcriptional regulator
MTDKQTFTIRMRADARALLDAASEDQRRSRASIIEALVRQHLAQYEKPAARLDRMLAK